MKLHRPRCSFFMVVPIVLSCCFSSAWASGRIRLESTFERWSWSQAEGGPDATLGEFTQRVFVGYDITRSLSVDVATGHLSASWSGYPTKGTGVSDRLGGMLDTRSRVTYRLGDRLIFRAGFNAPTGMTAFTPEELPLVQAVADRALGLEANRLGEGVNFDLGGSYARRLGPATIGVGAAFLRKGSFDVVGSTSKLDPGDQTSLAAGVDAQVSQWLWRNNLRTILFGKDALNAQEIGRTGTRVDFQSALLRRWSRTSLWVTGTVVRFGRGETIVGTSLKPDSLQSRGGEVYVEEGAERRISDRITLLGGVSAGMFYGPDQELERASFFRGQLGLRARAGRQLGAEIRASYGSGSLNEADPRLGNTGQSALSGLGGEVILTMGF